ncbi:uncharacterized protein MELLADRAFT_89774 [Melampsora larici-populina 98AG31]|uniref:Uncharacterized protein n=1 Tax=Melampsora larici-populina (strain 98AG31 / pathotype 3-4-7) TaxID=747676 RepID=F4RUK5_MELLP|nr:uncharacterized protein MELLADRAFT_89774 [Melampsora larici-populina 98AG31]EGG03978.1 hypothetical protein MELLADRAFT_89774 [Melampsora larici-populina 98AG31]
MVVIPPRLPFVSFHSLQVLFDFKTSHYSISPFHLSSLCIETICFSSLLLLLFPQVCEFFTRSSLK